MRIPGDTTQPVTFQPSNLVRTIAHREAHVAIIGLGSVGLPLAIAFARAGFRVTGIDIDQRKVDAITRGHSSIADIPSQVLAHDTVTTAVHASAKSTNGVVHLQPATFQPATVFSPERIDPGRTDYTVANTPKVVGGVTPACLAVATALYCQATLPSPGFPSMALTPGGVSPPPRGTPKREGLAGDRPVGRSEYASLGGTPQGRGSPAGRSEMIMLGYRP